MRTTFNPTTLKPPKACATSSTHRGEGSRPALTLATMGDAADFLLSGVEDRPADVVIGNPPYIRYDDLPTTRLGVPPHLANNAWPRRHLRWILERCLGMLKPDGRVGFICADRWMRTSTEQHFATGARRYAVEHIWTMHDVDAFEAQVSAYPAITVLANEPQGPVVVADTTADSGRPAHLRSPKRHRTTSSTTSRMSASKPPAAPLVRA